MKTKLLTLALLLLATALGASAYSFKSGGIYYNITGANTVEVTHDHYGCYTGSVTIPISVTYGGTAYTVTAIGEGAFAFFIGGNGNNENPPENLTSVYIPSSIKRIGVDAFWGCSGLYNLVIPNSVNVIEDRAFSNSGLRSIKIGNMVSYIGHKAFNGAQNLTSVTCMATTPPTICENTFDDPCSAILLVPKGCLNSYQDADYWLYSKDEADHVYDFFKDGIYYTVTGTNTVEVTFEMETVWDDNPYYFSRTTYTGSVYIPSSVTFGTKTYTVTAIGRRAFNYCKDMTSVNIPNTVTLIDVAAFDYCWGLTSVTIPNSVTTIEGVAFYNCIHMKSVSIPNSVTTIGVQAFFNCSSLTSVTIPNRVTTIEKWTFYGCSALTSVTIPNSVTKIDDVAFENCSSLTSVTIPSSVTKIGEGAFNNCSSLASVTIGSSVNSIGDQAFTGCPLAEVKCKAVTPPVMAARTVFDESVYTIDGTWCKLIVPMGCRSAYESTNWWKEFLSILEETYDFVVNGFYYHITGENTVEVVPKLQSTATYSGNVTVPSSVSYGGKTYTVTGVGRQCFANSSNLTGVTLPSTITYLGDGAFESCRGLTSLTLPNSLTEIGSNAFSFCTGLTNLTIPASVTFIGAYAFSYSYNLTNLALPSGLTYLGDGAFRACTTFTSITIPDKVTRIGKETFRMCTSLTSVSLGAGVNYIGSDAFASCPALTIVDCWALTPPTLYSSAFTSNHYSTVALYVPKGTLSAYQAADGWKNFTSIQEIPYTFSVNGIYYIHKDDGTVEVTRSYGSSGTYSGNVVIPSSVTYGNVTYQVTGIGSSAFDGSMDLTSVTIPGTVTSIGSRAFFGCSSLKSVVIPNSVTDIGVLAFSGCSGMTSVTLPNSLKNIGNYSFLNCYALTRLTIPSSVTSIGYMAFYGCTGLKAVTCLADTPPTLDENTTFSDGTYSAATLFVPKESISAYQVGTNSWTRFTTLQPHLEYALTGTSGDIEFITGDEYPWTNAVEDGRTFAVSGNNGVHGSLSIMTATVTIGSGGGSVSFDFKAWGEGSNYDCCYFLIDASQMFKYGARNNDWENYTAQLSAGTHILTWAYDKDSSVNPTGDYFAVDNVVVTGLMTVKPGDVDGDGHITIGDATAIIDLILSGAATVQDYPAADVDGDGEISIADVTALMDIIM